MLGAILKKQMDYLIALRSYFSATTRRREMTAIEIFQLSAKACGYEYEVMVGDQMNVTKISSGGVLTSYWWNPFIHAKDRWECLEELLSENTTVSMIDAGPHRCVGFPTWMNGRFEFIDDCPAEEFPARALASLKARTDSAPVEAS